MEEQILEELISQGENSGIEFKEENVKPEGLAKEMVAFSNTLGGVIIVGILCSCSMPGKNPGTSTNEIIGILKAFF